jgi:hypothetical protein
MNFKLALGDFVGLAGLLLATVGGQYLIGQSQIEASEARILGELKVLDAEQGNSIANLSAEIKSNTDIVISAVNSGMESREEEILLSVSDFIGDNTPFAVKVSNIPVPSPLYDFFVEASDLKGNQASIVSFDSQAMGVLRAARLDDENFARLQKMIEEAKDGSYKGLGFKFELDPDSFMLSKERRITLLNSRIESLKREVESLQE